MADQLLRDKKGNIVLFHPKNGRPHKIKKKDEGRAVYYLDKGFTMNPPKGVKIPPDPGGKPLEKSDGK